MLCIAEVDRECICIFQSCGRRWVGGQGFPTPVITVARNPMPQVWARGSGSWWGAAAQAQHFRGKLRGRREEWRECDKAGGGFGKGRGRNEQGKGGGVRRPGVSLSTVSQFPRTGGRFGSLSWNTRELLYWGGVPIPLMDEADTLTSVPSAISDGRHKGQRAASSHSSWPPATSEIASLWCHCPCVCRWLGPSKGESQWKSISCCWCSCEDSTGLQDHTLEIFFFFWQRALAFWKGGPV